MYEPKDGASNGGTDSGTCVEPVYSSGQRLDYMIRSYSFRRLRKGANTEALIQPTSRACLTINKRRNAAISALLGGNHPGPNNPSFIHALANGALDTERVFPAAVERESIRRLCVECWRRQRYASESKRAMAHEILLEV